MKPLIFAFVIGVLSLSSPLRAKEPKVVSLVTIEGATFKVRQRGEEAQVARQAALVNANAHHFKLAKQAAEAATNCSVIETFPIFALLNVVLDCSLTPPENKDAIVRRNQ